MATKLISGVLREIWQSAALLDGGGSESFATGIRCSPGQLSRAQAMLTLNQIVGAPNIAASLSIAAKRLIFTVVNSAAAGNKIAWTLDVTLNRSIQQARGSVAPPVTIVLGASALAGVQGDEPVTSSTLLPNADAVVNPDTTAVARYVLEDGTLTAPHKQTLTPGGVIALPLMGRTVRRDHSAFVYTIENGGTNGAAAMSVALPQPPANKAIALDWVWNGTDFISNGVIYLLM